MAQPTGPHHQASTLVQFSWMTPPEGSPRDQKCPLEALSPAACATGCAIRAERLRNAPVGAFSLPRSSVELRGSEALGRRSPLPGLRAFSDSARARDGCKRCNDDSVLPQRLLDVTMDGGVSHLVRDLTKASP